MVKITDCASNVKMDEGREWTISLWTPTAIQPWNTQESLREGIHKKVSFRGSEVPFSPTTALVALGAKGKRQSYPCRRESRIFVVCGQLILRMDLLSNGVPQHGMGNSLET